MKYCTKNKWKKSTTKQKCPENFKRIIDQYHFQIFSKFEIDVAKTLRFCLIFYGHSAKGNGTKSKQSQNTQHV